MNLVIGYGNPLRGDDGVGPRVAEQVRLGCQSATVLTPHQLMPELADIIVRAAVVVFIDASSTGEPGGVACSRIGRSTECTMDHVLSPSALLRVAHDAYGREPPAWLVRINGQAFEFGSALSAPVMRALPQAVQVVQRLIADE
jgi:hydrogenase maturation protease